MASEDTQIQAILLLVSQLLELLQPVIYRGSFTFFGSDSIFIFRSLSSSAAIAVTVSTAPLWEKTKYNPGTIVIDWSSHNCCREGILDKIKASEMLVAPRISECFGLGLL